jgi:hypothetical protein
MLDTTIRGLAFVAGFFLLLAGLCSLALGGEAASGGVWAILIGAAILVAATLQRARYRSEQAEMTNAEPGPGGGEPDYLEPRFLATTEVFVDPTTKRLMRAYVDPRTGERRYRAER